MKFVNVPTVTQTLVQDREMFEIVIISFYYIRLEIDYNRFGDDFDGEDYNLNEEDYEEMFGREKQATKMRRDRLAQSLNFPASRRPKTASRQHDTFSMARSCNNFRGKIF